MTTIAVTLLVFERCDLLDVGGPYEVFHTANRIAQRRGDAPCFNVQTVSSDGGPVQAYGGLRLVADRDAAAADDGVDRDAASAHDGVEHTPAATSQTASQTADGTTAARPGAPTRVVVVPGAVDVDAVIDDGVTLEALRAVAEAADVIVSVCTGSLLLAAAGLLADVPAATTHHEDLKELASYLGEDRVVGGVRWVDAGRIVTGGALANGLSVGIHLVHRLVDADLALAVAASLDLPWSDDQGATVAT